MNALVKSRARQFLFIVSSSKLPTYSLVHYSFSSSWLFARYYKIHTVNERPKLVLRQGLPNRFLVSLLLKKMEEE